MLFVWKLKVSFIKVKLKKGSQLIISSGNRLKLDLPRKSHLVFIISPILLLASRKSLK